MLELAPYILSGFAVAFLASRLARWAVRRALGPDHRDATERPLPFVIVRAPRR